MGKSTISMAIFNCYVKLPEGNPTIFPCIQQVNFVQPFTAFQVLPLFQTVIGEEVERTGRYI